jgi:hypothetical protein
LTTFFPAADHPTAEQAYRHRSAAEYIQAIESALAHPLRHE